MNNPWPTRLFLALLMAYWPADSMAQTNSKDAVRLTDGGNRVVYRLRYFDFEDVRNLEQLLDQIPDLEHALDDSLRGSEYLVFINTQLAGTAPRDLRDIGRRFSLEDIMGIGSCPLFCSVYFSPEACITKLRKMVSFVTAY